MAVRSGSRFRFGLVVAALVSHALAAGGCFFEERDLSAAGGTCDPTACPPGGECELAACLHGQCVLRPASEATPCGVQGQLACNGEGQCAGCGGDASKCQASECRSPVCTNDTCAQVPNGALSCNGGQGSCSDAGQCGKCDDGLQNGDETGVDCGPAECGGCAGEVCDSPADCASGFCSDGVCCDRACEGKCESCVSVFPGSGTCTPIPVGELDPAFPECDIKGGCGAENQCACEDGALTPGETDVDCGGTCGPTCSVGQACSGPADCFAAWPCADGVCCSTSCDGLCQSCNHGGLEGLCLAVEAGDPDGCSGGKVCDASGLCKLAENEPCASDFVCASMRCDMALNQCIPCSTDDDCPSDHLCIGAGGGFCAPSNQLLGDPCREGAVCQSGLCVDGVCCQVPCTGLCMACNTSYTGQGNGMCAPIIAGLDPQDECLGPLGANGCSGNGPGPSGDSTCGVP